MSLVALIRGSDEIFEIFAQIRQGFFDWFSPDKLAPDRCAVAVEGDFDGAGNLVFRFQVIRSFVVGEAD